MQDYLWVGQINLVLEVPKGLFSPDHKIHQMVFTKLQMKMNNHFQISSTSCRSFKYGTSREEKDILDIVVVVIIPLMYETDLLLVAVKHSVFV